MAKEVTVQDLKRTYQRVRRQLAALPWICQGSVLKRSYQRPVGQGLRTYGPYYSWTRKVDNKTVTVALSLEQYRALQRALANHRRMEGVLDQMRQLSEHAVFATTTGVAKRNR